MFCPNCGKQIEDDATFCPFCGANTAEGAPEAPQGKASAPKARLPLSGGAKKLLMGGVAVVAVAALAVGAFASGVFGGDKRAVEKAAAKSVAAFANAGEKAGLPDVQGLYESKKYSGSVEVALKDISMGGYGFYYTDYSVLEGIGLRYSADVNVDGQKLGASVTPFYGSVDLVTAQMVMDGSKLYIGSPELTKGTFYGLDTMTLGADLVAMGADDEIEDFGFNLFELVKQFQNDTEIDKDQKKELEKAAKALYKAIEVEKTGTETVDVNDHSVKCTAYSVVIPQEALEAYCKAVKTAVRSIKYDRALRNLIRSVGLPKEAEDELEDALDYVDLNQTGEIFDALEEVLDVLGDVEFTVYINGGYVMAVNWSERFYGDKIEVDLYLGGGKNYVDDLGLVLNVGGGDAKITLTSTGDHSAKNGTFTDETVLRVTDGWTDVRVKSELSYAPKKSSDNFSWSIKGDGFSVDMEGQLNSKKNEMELDLEKIKLQGGYNGNSVTLRLKYTVGSYKDNVSVKSPVMIATFDEDDLRDLVYDVQDYVEDWAYDIMDEIPSGLLSTLQYMMWYIF